MDRHTTARTAGAVALLVTLAGCAAPAPTALDVTATPAASTPTPGTSPTPTPAAAASTTPDAEPSAETDPDAAASPTAMPSPTAPPLAEQQGFQTPSGNIACLAADYGNGPYLQCEMGSQLQPPPDELCDFDWSGITMTGEGAARPLCASDTMRGELGADPAVLAYGTSWRAGPFTCESAETGLTCTNGDGGRLFLSRARWQAD